ncbi:hypothetical protein GCM10027592_10560 [Spirosoma flavus]
MKTFYSWFFVGMLTNLVGCVTIQSNSKSEAIPSFQRVLIVTKLRNAPASYVQNFARQFPTGYETCTLAISPLSFDNPDEAIRKKVADCQSDVILTLELVQRGQSSQYSSTPYEYNAEMVSAKTGESFWKAIIASNPSYGEQVPPRSILKRLLVDHIITGKIVDVQTFQASY